MSWIDDVKKKLEENRKSLREKGYDPKKLEFSEKQSKIAKVRGRNAKASGQIQSISKDKDIVDKRTQSIRESRKTNPLTNYDTWNRAMANRTEDWNQSIRNARQQQVIQQFDMDGNLVAEYQSYKVCQTQTGYSNSTIYKAVKCKMKQKLPNEAYGYLWRTRSIG